MIQSLVNASNFNAGYLCCRQLSFGLLDMAWHTLEQPFDGDVAAFEKKAWAPTVIMPESTGSLDGHKLRTYLLRRIRGRLLRI